VNPNELPLELKVLCDRSVAIKLVGVGGTGLGGALLQESRSMADAAVFAAQDPVGRGMGRTHGNRHLFQVRLARDRSGGGVGKIRATMQPLVHL